MINEQSLGNHAADNTTIEARASSLFNQSYYQLAVRNDRLFGRLLVCEWFAAMLLAFWITPRTYAGTQSAIHIHVYAAIFLGFAAISLPLLLIFRAPGASMTRQTIAAAQMVMCGLLIDLTGGRIETHFIIFGSLAFLAFYRDWRILILASAITAADHFLRGVVLPRSMYGTDIVGSWRWLEHGGYVVFEDIFLISSCLFGVEERRIMSLRQAELEFIETELLQTKEGLERNVQARTFELTATNESLKEEVAERLRREKSLRLAEEQLKAAKVAAEIATKAKSEFLANMSHEIRTPVTAMVGFADIMLDPDQTQSDRVDGLQTIRRNARHLLDLINEILDLSKIEAGRMTVEKIPTDLPPLLSDVMSMMRPRATEKGLELNLRISDKVPRHVVTDPVRVKQILMNLVSNALKFTEHGQVEIHVSSDPAIQTLNFEVMDTGIGITQEQMTKLFRPFTQADGSTTRRFGGTGLGLTISKSLAQLLGGDITVSSDAGVGSTFTAKIVGEGDASAGYCRLEDALMVPQSGPDQIVEKISGRILLAEDGIDNQRFISAMLRKVGAHVVIAENGRIAVEKARSESFDLILMDMQMPELDGYGATAHLRGRGFTGPIIALTAHAMAEDRAKCIKAGCTDYLTKPVDRKLLIKTVTRYMKGSQSVHQVLPTQAKPQVPAGNEIVSTCEGDPDMAEVLPEFIANLPAEVESIQSLLDQQNLAQLRVAIHQLKGAGGSYGFQCLTDAAAIAEHSLKSDASVETIRQQVESLVDMIRRVRGFAQLAEAK
jgi:signal transduction histidine kinase/CheY-like chemotaxis protein/HPt (histidine-containing phosphotransfer) domain-containing protein